jgi:hypothetical protein
MSAKPKASLAAKAVHMVFEFPGTIMKGWEAERVGEHTYLLHREDGSTREIDLLVPLRTHGGDVLPDRNAHGLLTIGEWSVLIGRGLNHEMHARKLGETNTYLLFDGDMKQLGRYKLGDDYNGGPVSQVDGHLLKFGDDIVPIRPKKYDITLLVMNTERDGGNLSYINFIEIGNKMNRKDGAQGTFYRPKTKGDPAEFVEVHGGQRVVTAMFWLEKNERKVTYQFRDASTAVMTALVSKQLEECRMIAISAGLDPEDYNEYVEKAKQLEELNMKWRKDGMSLVVGPDLFKPKSIDRNQENSPR